MNEGPLQGAAAGDAGKPERGPALRPVAPGETAPPAEAQTVGRFFRGRGGWWLVLVLVLAVVLAGYGLELAHSRSLETRIVVLEGELAVAEGQLQAYERRMVEVRGAVAALSDRIAGLQELLGQPVRGEAQEPAPDPAQP